MSIHGLAVSVLLGTGMSLALVNAAEAVPTRERGGVLTVSCSASVWAQELTLMAGELIARLNSALGEELVRELRCRTS